MGNRATIQQHEAHGLERCHSFAAPLWTAHDAAGVPRIGQVGCPVPDHRAQASGLLVLLDTFVVLGFPGGAVQREGRICGLRCGLGSEGRGEQCRENDRK